MRRLLVLIITSILLTGTCYADGGEFIDEGLLESAVPKSVNELLGTSLELEAADDGETAKKLINAAKAEIKKIFAPAMRRCLLVFLVAFLCSIFEVFGADCSPLYIKLCGCAGISAVCIGSTSSYISIGSDALCRISDFSNALLPTLCAAGVFCRTPATAAAKYAASALFMDIFIEISRNVILPLIYAYIALVISKAAFGSKLLHGMCSALKWLCTTAMIVLTLAFTAYLSISSVIASSGDAVVSKASKAAISMALPIIGSIISDASSSVVAGAEAIRSSVGVFGLITVLAICIVPFASIGVNFLLLKLTGAAAGAFNSDAGTLISEIGNSLSMLLAMIGSGGIMLFISIMSCIKAVSA